MAFKSIIDCQTGLDFNTSTSANFKALYDNIVYEKYKKSESRKPSQTFAPSSFRCDRLSFFRIRGVEPDSKVNVDTGLGFVAMLGTACHEEIQRNLISAIGDQWISVSQYLEQNPISHEYSIKSQDEYETRIEFFDPPVKFGCDGLLKIGEEFYILEIKTSEYQSFRELSAPKPQHIDQIKCYCSLLEVNKALVLYQDRMHGNTKCYELEVKDYEMAEIFDRMDRVMEYVEKNIAPPRLDKSDYFCNYCKYKDRCKQWG